MFWIHWSARTALAVGAVYAANTVSTLMVIVNHLGRYVVKTISYYSRWTILLC